MLVTMNDKEIFRLGTIRDVCEKRIRRKDAAQRVFEDGFRFAGIGNWWFDI
ncbi:hypothetical protein [Photobacterium leiognathi]|uniref:hypothetical protein n=1 Tax=Photobacterium leiognathi TaxID=553611 RepID=UPI002738F37D|nr:hypothetical protein [Photobacterium leiognathi]